MKPITGISMKTPEALAKLSADKLKSEIAASEKELYTLRMKMRLGELKQPHLVKYLRRYIASLKTRLHAMAHAATPEKN